MLPRLATGFIPPLSNLNLIHARHLLVSVPARLIQPFPLSTSCRKRQKAKGREILVVFILHFRITTFQDCHT